MAVPVRRVRRPHSRGRVVRECGVYQAWSAPAPQSSTPASAVSVLALQFAVNIARSIAVFRSQPSLALLPWLWQTALVFSMVPPRPRVTPNQSSRADILLLAPDNTCVGLSLYLQSARLHLSSCVLTHFVLIS
jgi:hypothetical protein